MGILNRGGLARTKKTRDAVDILEHGLAAADPARILQRFVGRGGIDAGGGWRSLDGYDSVYVAAFGKAAYAMSAAAARALPVKSGIVVVPHDSNPAVRGRKFRLYRAGHPLPDRRSVAAARTLLKFLANRDGGDFVLFLVSGGASSLLALPDGIALPDKVRATDMLLRCGASIAETNCVRKHISRVKGGRLVDGLACGGASLIMSDVENDDPETIASGMTHMDSSTFGDAVAVVEKYGLADRVHHSIMERLRAGADGLIPETPKSPSIPHRVVANNRTCLAAMEGRARALGYDTESVQHYGDVGDVAEALSGREPDRGGCLLFGGEPTVRVTGGGRGGRNQELVLRLARDASPGAAITSMGTDGIDGNTKSAGAIMQAPPARGADPGPYIKNNDSHSYFKRYGGLIRTGHTGTNLQDIGLVLR